jgi:hypothetical protein
MLRNDSTEEMSDLRCGVQGNLHIPCFGLCISASQATLPHSHAKKDMLLRLYDRRQAMLSNCRLKSMSAGESLDIGQPHASRKAC